jgi:type II secretory pathway component GspD/PulD (secretin)
MDAFETVLKMADLTYLKEGQIIIVYPAKTAGKLLGKRTSVHIYKIAYATLSDIQGKISSLKSDFGELITDDRLRLIIVRDLPENLAQIDKIVATLDAPPKQVLVEAMILDVNVTNASDMSVKLLKDSEIAQGITDADFKNQTLHPPSSWAGTGNTIGANSPLDLSGQGFYVQVLKKGIRAYLDAVRTTNNIEILSTPRVIALNHEKATIKSTDKISYYSGKTTTTGGGQETQTQTIAFMEAGTLLNITPHISDNGFILMEITPEISNITSSDPNKPASAIISGTTKVLVKDGQTILMGGLVTETNSMEEEGVPFISGIPFLGSFFRHKKMSKIKKEKVFLITPHIIDEQMLEHFSQEKAGIRENKAKTDQKGLDVIR